MNAIPKTHEAIEAHIREIQLKKKDIKNGTNKGISLGESGYFDSDIYDGLTGGKSKYEGYVTSIAANDEADDDDYESVSFNQSKRQRYTAPTALLNEVAKSGKDYDPFADRRRPTIADREDEYREKRRRMILSPERLDPFADGGKTPAVGSRSYIEIMREQLLRGEETKLRKKLAERAREGTLRASGSGSGSAAEKRGRWEQAEDAPGSGSGGAGQRRREDTPGRGGGGRDASPGRAEAAPAAPSHNAHASRRRTPKTVLGVRWSIDKSKSTPRAFSRVRSR